MGSYRAAGYESAMSVGRLLSVSLVLALLPAAPARAQADDERPPNPSVVAATSLLLPALAYAAMPITGGASALVAPALGSAGHFVAGTGASGLAVGLCGGALAVGGYYAGTRLVTPYGPAEGTTVAIAVGIPFVLWAAWDAHAEAMRRQPIVLPPERLLPPLTRKRYLLLVSGMSLEAANAVLGRPSVRVGSSRTPTGRSQITMRWANPDGSYAEATFEEDGLVGKAQRGLPDD